MKTTTRTKTEPRREVQAQIDAFLGFQVRIESLGFKAREVRRQQAAGEQILGELAALRPTGDVLRDELVRTMLETRLEEPFDFYSAALDRLWWESAQ